MSEFTEKDKQIVLPTQETSQFGAIQHFKKFSAGAGSSLVTIDETGFVAGNTVIIDGTGLNSLNNFKSVSFNDGTFSYTFTDTSYTAVTGADELTFTLVRSAKVFVYMSIGLDNFDGDLGEYSDLRLYDTVSGISRAFVIGKGQWAWNSITSSNWISKSQVADMNILTFAVGTHTLQLQARVTGGTGRLADVSYGAFILGI